MSFTHPPTSPNSRRRDDSIQLENWKAASAVVNVSSGYSGAAPRDMNSPSRSSITPHIGVICVHSATGQRLTGTNWPHQDQVSYDQIFWLSIEKRKEKNKKLPAWY